MIAFRVFRSIIRGLSSRELILRGLRKYMLSGMLRRGGDFMDDLREVVDLDRERVLRGEDLIVEDGNSEARGIRGKALGAVEEILEEAGERQISKMDFLEILLLFRGGGSMGKSDSVIQGVYDGFGMSNSEGLEIHARALRKPFLGVRTPYEITYASFDELVV